MTMLRLHDASGAVIGTLPHWLGDPAAQEELNETGSFAFEYPREGKNAELLLDTVDAQVSLVLGGDEVFRGLVEDDGDDPLDDKAKARPLQVSGRGTLAVLERGITLPQGGVGTVPAQWLFSTATPGKILADLITACQALGFLTNVTLDFTDTHDSAGQPWDHTISVRYEAGVDLLQVATALASQGVCDLRMTGLTLQVYNPETVLGVDRPTVMVRRKHLQSLPRKRSRRDLRSDVLAVGQDGVNVLRSDPTAQAKYGARLGYLSQGNTTHEETLQSLGDNYLAQHARPSEGYELPLRLTSRGCPQPWSAFGIGDFIRCDMVRAETGDVWEPLRVRRIAYSVTRDGLRTATVLCNDLFLEATVKLARRIDGIDNGYINDTGGHPVTDHPDLTGPTAPVGLALASDAVVDDNGQVSSVVFAEWLAPTVDGDGGVLRDLSHYAVRWRYVGDELWQSTTAQDVATSLAPVLAGRNVEVQVAAVDSNGNASPWTASESIVAAADADPPPQPSLPEVVPYLGQLMVTWDGLGSAGEAMPVDLARVEVHVSEGSGFTPDPSTLRGAISPAGGDWVVTGLTYGEPYYVRLVAVDTSGNPSAASAENGDIPERVSGIDLDDFSVDSNHLADLSVIRAKIADAAVDDAKIANLNAGKITAGFLDAERIELGGLPPEKFAVGSTNLIPDGSFEDAAWRAKRNEPQSYLSDAAGFALLGDAVARTGDWRLFLDESVATAYTTKLLTTAPIPVRPGDKLFYKGWAMRIGNPSATVALNLLGLAADGITVTAYDLNGFGAAWGNTIAADVWTPAEQVFEVPDGTYFVWPTVKRYDTVPGAGWWAFDDIELWPVLASTSTAGESVEVSPRGMIARAAGGVARVEYLGGGINAYDDTDELTVQIGNDGNTLFRGSLVTALAGERIEINPVTDRPQIRFYPEVGDEWAYIQGFTSDSGVGAFSAGAGLRADGMHGELYLNYNEAGLYYTDDGLGAGLGAIAGIMVGAVNGHDRGVQFWGGMPDNATGPKSLFSLGAVGVTAATPGFSVAFGTAALSNRVFVSAYSSNDNNYFVPVVHRQSTTGFDVGMHGGSRTVTCYTQWWKVSYY